MHHLQGGAPLRKLETAERISWENIEKKGLKVVSGGVAHTQHPPLRFGVHFVAYVYGYASNVRICLICISLVSRGIKTTAT